MCVARLLRVIRGNSLQIILLGLLFASAVSSQAAIVMDYSDYTILASVGGLIGGLSPYGQEEFISSNLVLLDDHDVSASDCVERDDPNYKFLQACAVGSASASIDIFYDPNKYVIFNNVAGDGGGYALISTEPNAYTGGIYGYGLTSYFAEFILDTPAFYSVDASVYGAAASLGSQNTTYVRLVDYYNNYDIFDYVSVDPTYGLPQYYQSSGILYPGHYRIYAHASCDAPASMSPDGTFISEATCDNYYSFSLTVSEVPDPPSLYLLSSGLFGIVRVARRKKGTLRM